MSEWILEVKSLTKQIKGKKIVDDVSFQVKKGEVFGLLGPNGAGKTTIIRMIVSLINRTSGQVIVKQHSIDSSFKEAMEEIGAIVENPEFYKYLSGYKNLLHYAHMSTKKISKERIEEVIRLVNLEDAIHNKVKTYSLGMRQRLGVAQALLHSPSLLILDEPTNGLDPQGIRDFRDYLRQLASEGISVLVSSHLLSEMELMCDRFAIIEKGKLTHISTISEEFEKTETDVQEFEFIVSDGNAAFSLLQAEGKTNFVTNYDDTKLTVQCNINEAAELNKLLVNSNIIVYGFYTIKASLEDRFLEITSHEKEGVTS
ncbi:ATP-binding cassette domain-containing protein [Bacillus sp. AGMB 02131]|uniref:ATP-binding cassette domain-containing protein n=1 Tax=Peribacillus faecalis TaxID=2772559 RepID=A0A927CUN7_9BACI|nr:ATP-binding cassette domain-containing protein [Peribacillus faecalis]MBD3107893.1 ATP-binding cassette domain-containing protein [Peribacillus faecalis]